MWAGLAYRWFRINFRNLCQRKVQLRKVEEVKFADNTLILYKMNYSYKYLLTFFYETQTKFSVFGFSHFSTFNYFLSYNRKLKLSIGFDYETIFTYSVAKIIMH